MQKIINPIKAAAANIKVPTSHITKTTCGKYDQIFALSQSYINESLKALFANVPELHTLNTKNIEGSITNAGIDPPEVSLEVLSGQNIVLFYMNLSSGYLKLRDIDSGDWVAGMPDAGWDLKGCRIAFKVAIGTEGIKPDDPAHKAIMDQIHGDPSDYSLTRLYMDLTSADLSSFIGAPESKLPDGVVESSGNWVNFFSNWMLQAHNHKTNTLGYKVDALNPKIKPITVDPTFQPTLTQFQTCEWRNESNGKVVGGLEAGGNNCLLYLQQTMDNPAPDPLRYDYTGNMVEDGKSGSLMISRKLFWDKWLLPELQILNYKTLLVATGAHCSGNEVQPDWEYHWAFGQDAAHQANRKSEMDLFYAWKPKPGGTTGPYGFTFSDHSRKEDSGGIWGSKLGCYIDCVVNNEISFTPGALPGVIGIKGTTACTIERDTTAAGTAHAWVTMNWSCDIEMSSISETSTTDNRQVPGGLETRIVNANFPPVTTNTDAPKIAVQTAPDGVKNDIANLLNSTGLDAITKNIEMGLSGVHKFILPGNGTFAMFNPTFNNDGDFLVDIKYEPSQTNPK